jgi:hypothetical protein
VRPATRLVAAASRGETLQALGEAHVLREGTKLFALLRVLGVLERALTPSNRLLLLGKARLKSEHFRLARGDVFLTCGELCFGRGDATFALLGGPASLCNRLRLTLGELSLTLLDRSHAFVQLRSSSVDVAAAPHGGVNLRRFRTLRLLFQLLHSLGEALALSLERVLACFDGRSSSNELVGPLRDVSTCPVELGFLFAQLRYARLE